MPVESAADRLALLADFGLSVRLFPTSGEPIDVLGILELPTSEIAGVALEAGFLEPAPSLLVRTAEFADFGVENRLEILEGTKSGGYIARAIVAEEDGEFSRVDIAES